MVLQIEVGAVLSMNICFYNCHTTLQECLLMSRKQRPYICKLSLQKSELPGTVLYFHPFLDKHANFAGKSFALCSTEENNFSQSDHPASEALTPGSHLLALTTPRSFPWLSCRTLDVTAWGTVACWPLHSVWKCEPWSKVRTWVIAAVRAGGKAFLEQVIARCTFTQLTQLSLESLLSNLSHDTPRGK